MPALAEYFHLNAESYTLRFKARAPIRLYYGPSLLKPGVLNLIARNFDGVILQTLYGIPAMEETLNTLADARQQSALAEPLRKVMLLNASVSRDGQAAKQHAKRFVSHIASGWPDDTLIRIGIDPQSMEPVRQAYAQNRGVDYAASITPDEAVEIGRAFAEAGADLLFVEAPQTIDEVAAIPSKVTLPVIFNLVPGGRTPSIPLERLREYGASPILYKNLVIVQADLQKSSFIAARIVRPV